MGITASRVPPAAIASQLSSSVEVPRPVNKEHVFDAIRAGDANRLSSLFYEGRVDLSAINEELGGTALHLAISEKNDDILKLLLDKAGNDPTVLDAKDRDGCTPLMCAASKMNVPMMKALVDAGAGVDIHYRSRHELSGGLNHKIVMMFTATSSAQMLLSAKGDVSTAFLIAAEKNDIYAQVMFFRGGADSLSALQSFINQKKWGALESMFAYATVRQGEVTTVLEDAVKAEDSDVIGKLAALDKCKEVSGLLARYALNNDTKGVSTLLNAWPKPSESNNSKLSESLLAIAEKQNRSDSEKIAAMKRIVNPVGCDEDLMRGIMPDDMLSTVLATKKFNVTRLMVDAGVPAKPEQLGELLIGLAENNQLSDIKALIRSGADISSPRDLLIVQGNDYANVGNHEAAQRKQDAANNLIVAFVETLPKDAGKDVPISPDYLI